jgi:phosphomannomutase
LRKNELHMTIIKFGTDGWRAAIAMEFTVDNVARVAEASALWALQRDPEASVVVGHDCRFGGELFAETTARVFLHHKVKVYLASSFVSTPMISLAAKQLNTTLGVIITASHNPPGDNGYKLKGGYGGPLLENDITAVEALIPECADAGYKDVKLEPSELFEEVNLDNMYCDYLAKHFDLEAIRRSGMQFAFDAMYGSGQNIMRRLFPNITLVHCERKPLFDGVSPEPLMRNLHEFAGIIRQKGNIQCGLAVDGDADRIALFDQEGNYIDSHHVILLLIHYLHHYKKLNGKVATGFSSTVKINKLCEAYGLPLEVVQIGFKHICGLMLKENILVGGEESGGIAVTGHIPERDGIYNGILIWEALVESGKTLRDLIEEVYAITGSFAFERSDLRIRQEDKDRIVKNCREGLYKQFGKYKVIKTEDLDGFKYYFSEHQWLMIRPSGTEPVLRTYAEGKTQAEALHILQEGFDTIMKA